jgi:CO dehydrogenase/acetyl-CoA synthase beta subunit
VVSLGGVLAVKNHDLIKVNRKLHALITPRAVEVSEKSTGNPDKLQDDISFESQVKSMDQRIKELQNAHHLTPKNSTKSDSEKETEQKPEAQ